MSGRVGSREWWIVGLLVTALGVLLAYDGTLRRADAAFYDLLRRVDARPPDPAILIVTIDDRSLAEMGAWPWPRERHARLIATLDKAHARLIGYDILFLEPRTGDAALAAAMRGRTPVFLPVAVEHPGTNGAPTLVREPVSMLAYAARGLGHVNVAGDPDGPVRHGWLWDGGPEAGVPHLVLAMARALGAADPPADPAPVLIPYGGPSGHYPAISAAALLRGEVPPELLLGRVILVGATAPGMGDQHPVAVGGGGTMAGVEVQANLLDGLLSQRLIHEGGWRATALLALPFLWAMLVALRFLSPRRALLMLALLLLAVLAASAASLLWFRLWIGPATSVVLLLVVHPLWNWRRLAAAHAYMGAELERLRREPDPLAAPLPAAQGGDPVTRQTVLLAEAIGRLRTLRAFIASILDQLPDRVVVTDARGTILFANDSASPTDPAPYKGGALADLLEDLRPAPGHDAPARASFRPETSILLTPDDRALSYSLAPWSDGSAAPAGWIARFSDVTALRRVEAQREEVLRFLTHDMRSPQASILACLSTAAPGEIDAALSDRIAAYARRTLDLADGFVRLARAEAQGYRLEPVALAEMAIDAADDLWPLARAAGVTIRILDEAPEIDVAADRSLLTRALINLLSNAVKASAADGEVRLILTTRTIDGRVLALCTVEDDGPGVPADHVPGLFTRFASRSEGEGIGLGLSFVEAVARGHGGRAWYEGSSSGGARFCLTLIVAPVDSAPPA